MTTVQYVCATTSRTLHGRMDQDAAWFDMKQVAHLFGTRLDKATKLLWQVGATGEIDTERDVRWSDCKQCLLSHRGVLSVGYHVDYGRATAFRKWCASAPVVLRS
ncbi:hypothetical protein NK8_04820 [Caballeronia sp. NK8]|nr:hypothetical protein NK8_04820 [Caballeronia sp. NK8]